MPKPGLLCKPEPATTGSAGTKRMPDGFRCAPEMCPVDNITTITARPAAVALPIRVSAPLCFWFTMGAATAENTMMNVPTNSAPSCHIHANAESLNEKI